MTEPLSDGEILRLTNYWIGIVNGYLGESFGYAAHREFYPLFCLIDDIDPDTMPGTTRRRFERILGDQSADRQARILRGVLDRFPPGSSVPAGSRANRGPQNETWIRNLIERLEGGGKPDTTSATTAEGVAPSSEVVARTESRAIRIASLRVVSNMARELADTSPEPTAVALAEMVISATEALRDYVDAPPRDLRVELWLNALVAAAGVLVPVAGALGALGIAVMALVKDYRDR